MTRAPQIVDRALLKARRTRAAKQPLSGQDFLLCRAAEDFAGRLSFIKRSFETALELGSHHGVVGRRLSGVAGIKTIVALDSVEAMLARCGGPRIQGDEEALPRFESRFDLVISAHALHLVNDLPGTLVQARMALRPDGLLLASFPGGRTLAELRAAWLEAESERLGGASPRVVPFADVRDCGALLQRAGFALPVADSETITVTYASPIELMAELKAMGQSNPLTERSRRPVMRGLLARVSDIYLARFGLPGGRVPATFEILTLTGWAPHESQQKPLEPGSAKARLADALGVKEEKL